MRLKSKEILKVYKVLEDFHRFFHQPENYKNQVDVLNWLKNGHYDELSSIYYDILPDLIDADTMEKIREVGVENLIDSTQPQT